MNLSPNKSKRRWLAPEVVQTSAMDCGPASLKCLLEGFDIPVSYGRLREACQTSVDGTSIDMLEEVANQLGVEAQQVMIPVDHVFLPEADILPAMVVVRQSDGTTHFVVIWRRHGRWLQVMDPAIGRRWVVCRKFAEDIYKHEMLVDASAWYDWASSDVFLKPLRQQLTALGLVNYTANELIDHALASSSWFELAKLDAAIRLLNSLVGAEGIETGKAAADLLKALIAQVVCDDECYVKIPRSYWSVIAESGDFQAGQVWLKGAVLLKIKAKPEARAGAPVDDEAMLSPELAAALKEKPVNAAKTLLDLLKADGILSPLALIGALTISVAAILLETLLFRGIFDIAWELKLTDQRMAAAFGLLLFVTVLLLIEVPVEMESLRFGRHLEVRLRMALLKKLPNLSDRYFQSRPISDMAERSHSIALTRLVPGLAIQFVQTFWTIVFTLGGIILIDPDSALLASVITVLAILLPLLAQPLLNERDLRVRSHSGALFSFYLDALMGLVPVRAHRAEQAISREHEGLLVEWARSSRSLIQLSLAVDAVQSIVCTGLVCLLLFQHFIRSGGVTGGDLLLVYWALKLPAIGHSLTAIAHQYPAQRSVLLRLLEPLATPEENENCENAVDQARADSSKNMQGVEIAIQSGSVVAAGHCIIQDVNLTITPGEHIAIVGLSGAGKSTLLGLLLGWHRLASGQMTVDGCHLTGVNQQALRQQTAWIDPSIQIWNRSFLDNLLYSSQGSGYSRVAGVIDAATLRGVLQKLPQGLQTYLGEGGGLLSGGEGQRVRLARALLQNGVRLALLDEPFRGMDREQRQKLMGEARQWWASVTLICVTHDVEETLSFNRVLVVEDGRIVEDGDPNRLASKDSRYRALLNAEIKVHQQRWRGEIWQRIKVKDGTVVKHGQDVSNG